MPSTGSNQPASSAASLAVMTDERLMLMFRTGDAEAFAELFRRYNDPIYGFFRRRLENQSRAEELAQETFVAILRGIKRYEPRSTFRTYLYGIAIKILMAERRKSRIVQSTAMPASDLGIDSVDWLLQTPAGRQIETRIYSRNETLHTAHLLDLEVAQVLRRLLAQGTVTTARADQALQDLLDLRITRYAHFPFLSRIWKLHHNFSAYDAAYVGLAETLGAPLITRDARLASTSGHSVFIELF